MQVVWSALRQKSRHPKITFAVSLSLSLSLSLILLWQKCLSLELTQDEIRQREEREAGGGGSVSYRGFLLNMIYEALNLAKYTIINGCMSLLLCLPLALSGPTRWRYRLVTCLPIDSWQINIESCRAGWKQHSVRGGREKGRGASWCRNLGISMVFLSSIASYKEGKRPHLSSALCLSLSEQWRHHYYHCCYIVRSLSSFMQPLRFSRTMKWIQ